MTLPVLASPEEVHWIGSDRGVGGSASCRGLTLCSRRQPVRTPRSWHGIGRISPGPDRNPEAHQCPRPVRQRGLDDKAGPAAAAPVSLVATLIDTCETAPLSRKSSSHGHRLPSKGASQLTETHGHPPALLRHGNASTAADPWHCLIVCVCVIVGQVADPQPHQPQ
jgi:hypothetical protein